MTHGYAKDPVGAHYGTGNWLVQRITALVMAAYIAIAVPYALWRAPASHAQWKALFAGGFFRLATMLFLASLIWHAWIGMRDILIDYVHHYAMRLATQAAVAIVLAFYVAWSFSILWGR
ncbi:MAG TPA: succinate dehydrogenase, hydrophobic membrane anchor protein [Usitatibacter sp.]|nr:succinate dehydrogenase, hydrophobic membrane anchor protein [Usitatibacter sp.]